MAIIDTPGDDMLTVSQVSRQFKVNPETVRRWAREDKVPAQKIGNMLFSRASDIANGVGKGGNSIG